MTFKISSPVTTAYTPSISRAALVSMEQFGPCATVLRNIFPVEHAGDPHIMTYSARPVTLARASRRGTSRPIWFTPVLPSLRGEINGEAAPSYRPQSMRVGQNDTSATLHPRPVPMFLSPSGAPERTFSASMSRVTFSVAAYAGRCAAARIDVLSLLSSLNA